MLAVVFFLALKYNIKNMKTSLFMKHSPIKPSLLDPDHRASLVQLLRVRRRVRQGRRHRPRPDRRQPEVENSDETG
jgi:hypothetical protein